MSKRRTISFRATHLLLCLLSMGHMVVRAWIPSPLISSVIQRPTSAFAGRYSDGESNYWEEDGNKEPEPRFSDEQDEREEAIEWERCETDGGVAQILLPPMSVEVPTAVLHFCGGTFFGSAPNVWYKQLLQDLVTQTNVAIVATTIPVTLMQSPLDHVKLAKQTEEQFRTSWRKVLVDEYGATAMKKVPVCGVGHSLGARLLVVLATLRADKPVSPSYKAHILMSFTNFGAAAGIPGLNQLSQASRKEDMMRENKRSKPRRRAAREDEWYDDYDDEDWDDLVEELQYSFREQTSRFRSALTPKSEDLEFFPPPDRLWKALQIDNRYRVPQTLVVQFDRDDIDQSSKLATAVCNSTDVKFARLRGNHLTPVSSSPPQSRRQSDRSWLGQVNAGASKVLTRILAGQTESKIHEVAIRELRQSIKRYITEVVTK